jgi:hypothetical protein
MNMQKEENMTMLSMLTVKMESEKNIMASFKVGSSLSTAHPTYRPSTPSCPLTPAVMSTSFSSLPIVSLSALSSSPPKLGELTNLAVRLDEVFSTTGFAYLTDLPITYSHEDVFDLCDDFFGAKGLSVKEKMKLAKKTFVKTNANTYRG